MAYAVRIDSTLTPLALDLLGDEDYRAYAHTMEDGSTLISFPLEETAKTFSFLIKLATGRLLPVHRTIPSAPTPIITPNLPPME